LLFFRSWRKERRFKAGKKKRGGGRRGAATLLGEFNPQWSESGKGGEEREEKLYSFSVRGGRRGRFNLAQEGGGRRGEFYLSPICNRGEEKEKMRQERKSWVHDVTKRGSSSP